MIQASDNHELEEKIDFVKKNLDEKLLQTMDRYFFHETSFALAPLNEMKLGKPWHEVFSQYGFLSVLGLSAVMDFFGGFSYPNYEKAIKLSYFAYYLCFLFVARKIFARPSISALLILAYSVSFFLNSYYFYQYPPGHAPIRHFFDLVVLYFVARFGTENKLPDLLLATAFVVLSIFTSKDYGLMLAAAFVIGGSYHALYGYFSHRSVDRRFLCLLLIATALFVTAIRLYPLADNPSAKYFIDGFYSFHVTSIEYIAVLASILVQTLILFFNGNRMYERKRLFFYVFSAAYSQCLYFYYVWGGRDAHFFTFLVIYLLPYMIFIDTLRIRHATFNRFSYGASMTLLLGALTWGAWGFLSDYRASERVFSDHLTYTWSLPRAKGMVTTTDPAPFEDAVSRIRRNSPENRVFMISKYDDILSILSEKYSGTDFFELRSMIVTRDEYRRIRSQLETADTIFVDNDIDRDFEEELNRMLIWNMLPPLFSEHRYQRIPKLQELKKLYRDVIPGKFTLAERGTLISVYRRVVD